MNKTIVAGAGVAVLLAGGVALDIGAGTTPTELKYDHAETRGVYDTPSGNVDVGYAEKDTRGGYEVATLFPGAQAPLKYIWSATLPGGVIEAHKIGTTYLDVYQDGQGGFIYSTTTQTAYQQYANGITAAPVKTAP